MERSLITVAHQALAQHAAYVLEDTVNNPHGPVRPFEGDYASLVAGSALGGVCDPCDVAIVVATVQAMIEQLDNDRRQGGKMKRAIRVHLEDGSASDLELDEPVITMRMGTTEYRNIYFDKINGGGWHLAFNIDWLPAFPTIGRILIGEGDARIADNDGLILHTMPLTYSRAIRSRGDLSFVHLEQIKGKDAWKFLWTEHLFPKNVRPVALEIIREN